MPPSPSSGELWEHHLMPQQVTVDCLLPTGVMVPLECGRDATLDQVKKDLWIEAKKYPLFKQLLEPSSYIFLAITQDAMREEFYDETRRLCDLRLFQPILKIMEPRGNRQEKMLNYEIGMLIGMPVNEFNENKDLEVVTFRRNILKTCQDVVKERDAGGDYTRALYVYPPEVEASRDLPQHLIDKLQTFGNEQSFIFCVWVVSDTNDRVKYTVKVPVEAYPSDVIAETIRRRSRIMNMSRLDAEQCIADYKHCYVLKVCGSDQFLLAESPVSQYKYIRQCLGRGDIPQLMLHTKESVYETLHDTNIITPSYMQRGIQALAEVQEQRTMSIWDPTLVAQQTRLRIKVSCATYVNIKEVGKIFVRGCIYHGTEPLCEARDSPQVDSSSPRWESWLEWALELPDLPRSSRLCLSICAESKRRNRKVQYALAWGNLQLFDFLRLQLNGRQRLAMWSMPQGMDDLLNPIGTTGSNPAANCPTLELECDALSLPLSHPLEQHFTQLAKVAEHAEKQGKPTLPISPEDLSALEEIADKDPLSDLSEQEKALLWRLRENCRALPKALPKLINAVKWGDRHSVAQMYELLARWPPIPAEVALELLDCCYPDPEVRAAAVAGLEANLGQDKLQHYLLQLVQALKYEPYLDNPLTRFLLKRSLLSQRIGSAFFWHLKSEMHQTSIRLRFGLILEAYCRACGPYLKNLSQQVEALDKLTKLTDQLKAQVSSDEHQKYLASQLQQPDYKEALQNLHSPLNPSHILGQIKLSECKVMTSKKLPLWLTWVNPDSMADCADSHYRLMFKNGDDLRQDMLTLQVIRLMDAIWKDEGLDLKLIPYGCLSTGSQVGVIEVVQRAKTITAIQSSGGALSSVQLDSSQLHKWIKENNQDRYERSIELFKRSCAGYCVATFVLGIGDRHPENIMVTSQGQVFHIDFGHFLDHKKKKYGIKRERVPFVLTEDFQRVIAKGASRPDKHPGFKEFQALCLRAYLILRQHASLLITLFSMMLQCGIPELQSLDDIGYIRKTLCVEGSEDRASQYFVDQFRMAYGDSWTTKVDWMFHNMRHKSKGSSATQGKKDKLDAAK